MLIFFNLLWYRQIHTYVWLYIESYKKYSEDKNCTTSLPAIALFNEKIHFISLYCLHRHFIYCTKIWQYIVQYIVHICSNIFIKYCSIFIYLLIIRYEVYNWIENDTVSLVPVCLPPPPPREDKRQQELSLAYVTTASKTQHTGWSTPCTDGLIIFPPLLMT